MKFARMVPLYLECLMPHFFVDQLTGWRDLKSRMPTYLRVPEMAKRSAEYVLDLDILKRSIEKQRYQQEEARARDEWGKAVQRAKDMLGQEEILIRGLPGEPAAIWPPTPAPQVLITDGTDWSLLLTAIEGLQARLDQLVGEEIPKAEEVSQQVIQELRAAEERLAKLTDQMRDSSKDLMAERAHLESVHTPPPVIKFGFDVRSTWNPESQRIKVKVDFSFRAFFDESEDVQPPPLFVEVRFALSYVLTSTDGIDEQKVDAFGKMNGVYNAWPYIREFVQSTLTRMSLPALTLPVLTSGMLTGIYREEEQFASSSVDNGCVE